ncbi:NADH-quinone oxidoreductase subunit C [Alkalicaulis satelles]|uniref:NADH-quinone oxidoreductase subunit C n=1 Tax=Alkalicaulis satelles TaxID=2609175 RepID=A0A5M6ZK34_9PROT|nr:NADH-quinone oxidoreductase subunit C [Alkalicaulis satelles]KAA5805192.1 NADH-quinone oxidoreductase subunit C [Alkalicaulis satelles]
MSKTDTLKELAGHIESALDEHVRGWEIAHGELTVTIHRDRVVKVMGFLRDDPACRFTTLVDICGVDWPQRSDRFDVVYHLLSMHHNHRVRVILATDEDTPVESIVSLYPAANWFEREAFDMYGILFDNHPDLRRILTDYGFHGHPLRKDFPLTGFTQMVYDEAQKRVVYEPVSLVQEYRDFDFLSPWEGAKYVLPGDEKAEGKA